MLFVWLFALFCLFGINWWVGWFLLRFCDCWSYWLWCFVGCAWFGWCVILFIWLRVLFCLWLWLFWLRLFIGLWFVFGFRFYVACVDAVYRFVLLMDLCCGVVCLCCWVFGCAFVIVWVVMFGFMVVVCSLSVCFRWFCFWFFGLLLWFLVYWFIWLLLIVVLDWFGLFVNWVVFDVWVSLGFACVLV